MGIFGRILDVTRSLAGLPDSSSPSPRRWYGVPPPKEDDLIHKYCTGQVDAEGKEIPKPPKAPDPKPPTPEELDALLKRYAPPSEPESPAAPITSDVGVESVSELASHTSEVSIETGSSGEAYSDSAHAIGAAFENEVHEIVEGLAAIYSGEVFTNLVLPRDDGNTSELDLLVVLSSWIVVVECKGWHGVVRANYDTTQNWLVVYRKKRRFEPYSPVKQNATHIRTLSAYLGIKPSSIASVVVFPDSTTLMQMPPGSEHLFVGHISEFKEYLARLALGGNPQVPYLELSKSKLRMLQRKSEYAGKRHRNVMESRKANDLCPVCGHKLVRRVPRKGGKAFLGCSMFPLCKYIKKLE